MATARYSLRAKSDLFSIGRYTLRTWGEAQTLRYLDALEHCAGMLARNPALGRKCDWIRAGLYRFESDRHVLFYRCRHGGILIVRILHQSMQPDRHSFEDAEPNA